MANPASRLHLFLSEVCRLPAGNPARSCFAGVFALNPENTPLLLERLSAMATLVVQTEEQIRQILQPDEVHRYLNWKPQVLEAFGGITLSGPIEPFVQPLCTANSLALERLRYCADRLEGAGTEREISQDELNQLRTEVRALSTRVQQSDIDPELRLFLLYQFGCILDAIDQYKLVGIRPLVRATNEFVGSLLLDPENRERITKSNISNGFWKVLRRLVLIGVAAEDVHSAVDYAMKLLGYG